MNKDRFIKEVEKLGISLTNEQIDKFNIYLNFLKEYNNHTNLTAIKNDEDIYLKHFYDSLTPIKYVDFKKYNSLLDIGSGAGFPGMVLKIVYPKLDVTLIDSNNKKTTFLEKLAKELNLNVKVVNDRVENYSKFNLNKFDIVISRAVANLRVLSELALPLVSVSGIFVPMKGNISGELDEALDTIAIMNAKIINIYKFDLYENFGNRTILVIRKNEKTNIKDIREYSKIIKKPLYERK